MASILAHPAAGETPAADIEKEIWRHHLARLKVAFDQARDSADFFARLENASISSVPDFRDLSELATRTKTWPAVAVEGDTLRISSAGALVIVKPRSLQRREFWINDRLLVHDPTVPFLDQLRKVFPLKEKSPSSALLIDLLLPRAEALGPLGATGIGLIAGGAATGNTGLLAAGSGLLSSGAAGPATALGTLAAGKIALIGAAVVGAGWTGFCGLVVADAALSNQRRIYGEQVKGPKFSHCMALPLRLLKLNPYDRLYARELSCGEPETDGSRKLTVRLQSPNDDYSQTREFVERPGQSPHSVLITAGPYSREKMLLAHFKAGPNNTAEVHKVEGLAGKNSGSSTQNQAGNMNHVDEVEKLNRDPAVLKELSALAADFSYYKGLCDDPQRMKVFKEEVKSQGLSNHRASQPAAISSDTVR